MNETGQTTTTIIHQKKKNWTGPDHQKRRESEEDKMSLYK